SSGPHTPEPRPLSPVHSALPAVLDSVRCCYMPDRVRKKWDRGGGLRTYPEKKRRKTCPTRRGPQSYSFRRRPTRRSHAGQNSCSRACTALRVHPAPLERVPRWSCRSSKTDDPVPPQPRSSPSEGHSSK